jgi:phage terminase large subunit-like protein
MTSTTDAAFPHVAAMEQYVDDVLSGRRVEGLRMRQACERHRRDVARIFDDAWPYTFNVELAEKAARFFERFPHLKGKWASKRLPPKARLLKLEPWQCFGVCSIFGWVKKEKSEAGRWLRRFRRVRKYIARKNGKSMFAAPTGLFMLTADGEEGAEVYSGATNEKQAWEIFGPAKQMASERPDFCQHYGVEVNAKSIVRAGSMAKFLPIVGKPGDGANVHCSLTDEYHEHETDQQLATMETGMGSREQPLSVIVSTAGDNIAGPCREDWLYCEKVLDGIVVDEELFAMIFQPDKEDDWTSEIALMKANPNLGVSIDAEALRSEQARAAQEARLQNRFKIKHLNIWVQARDAYYNIERWRECARPGMKIEQFAGRRAWLSLDLASKNDLCSLCALIPTGIKGKTTAPSFDGRIPLTNVEFAVFWKHYLPRDTVDKPENDHYRTWEKEGWLTVTEGNVTDYFLILEDLRGWNKLLDVADNAYDPGHGAAMFVTAAMNNGLTMIEYGATVLNFSEPMKETEAAISGLRMLHNGDKVAEWALSNVVNKRDRKDNDFPNKERYENKIDPIVAKIMAMGRFLAGDEDPEDDWSGFLTNTVVSHAK